MPIEQGEVKPEALIRLGSHHPDSAPNLDSLEDNLRGYLRFNPSGKVYVFLENAFYNHQISQHVTDRVASGYPLSYVLTEMELAFTYERVPTQEEVLKQVKRFFCDPKEKFLARETQIIDKLQLQFPDQEGERRIGVITEAATDEELQIKEQARKRYDENVQKSLGYVYNGQFEEGLLPFQEATLYLAEGIKTREPRMVDKICEYLQKDDTIAVIATLGTAHTGVAHGIRRRGFIASYDLVQQESPLYLFQPGVTLVRRCAFLGMDSISSTEWRQGLIGDAAYDLLEKANNDLKKGLSEQHMVRMASAFTQNFTKQEEIDDFERNVRKYGFLESVESISFANA
ncbi:hypothetical protein A3J19_01920 [Candidatus Daviesbacteria bacterium RIFCSPLOWO2_02_FULL_41_8]|uniref:Uncharacterized protein n=3 Tax=Candidatus Daviesiibacteriota TaxID=1752718 RepID=A0A1F5NHK1_9BACT|nr:MAG: hypothetical protein A2871_01080 [Candidatus Daviesbacteria bacterium RIFCSPHIGHO2_01_FULL_41_23]OGE32636.1 MAG: hypothetical protein A3D83_01445 [Candidatus Daviesbacteria bacterium RIFCSPHIGHO2_02_FULL_41_10]OGE62488.1 MAG: hypothetical protein A2967_01565 [Candidatus Daviesbacteria bacterium RIFCSPLOWO2_01_FULL_41_32]OGE77157.1 MAG: hypothetical protein A3J19_01920 [Candidatus Daviesbacteria bacterium RIFCSPLOWO2_02_FULL_41_8]